MGNVHDQRGGTVKSDVKDQSSVWNEMATRGRGERECLCSRAGDSCVMKDR